MPKRSSPKDFEVNHKQFAIVYEWILYSGVTGEAIKLYAALQRFSNKVNNAWPSMDTLSERVGMSERSVQRYLAELVEIDAVRVENRSRSNGSSASSLYHLWPYEKPGFTPPSVADLDDDKSVTPPPAPVTSPSVSPLERELINEHQLVKKKGRPRKNPEPKYTPEFEEFYSLYPKPLNKEQTFKNWTWTTTTDRGTPGDIMGAVRGYLKEIERKGTDPDFFIVSANFVGQKQRWTEYQVPTIDPETLEQAKAWDEWDSQDFNSVTYPEPSFPRPQNSEGHLLDGEGRAYYRDPMQPTKRRYFDDE